MEVPDPGIKPIKSNNGTLINIVAAALGTLFLLAILVMFLTFKKLKQEKMKHRAMERVNQWTKRVIVVQPSVDNMLPGLSESLVCLKNTPNFNLYLIYFVQTANADCSHRKAKMHTVKLARSKYDC